MDAPTAWVVVSGIIAAGASIVTALIKFQPQAKQPDPTGDCDSEVADLQRKYDEEHKRLNEINLRQVRFEENAKNMDQKLNEVRADVKEIRVLLTKNTGDSRRD